MKIRLVVPDSSLASSGDVVTAKRWAEIFYALHHEVTLGEPGEDTACDVLVAIGAAACAAEVHQSYRAAPQRAVVVAITGPDLEVMARQPAVNASIELATRIVTFQAATVDLLPRPVRHKVSVIFQSAVRLKAQVLPRRDCFSVIAVANLRDHKQPLLIAEAARLLPTSSRIRIEHYGAAIDGQIHEQVRRETLENGRYHWSGEVAHRDLRKRLASSSLLVNTARIDDGANAISEAAVDQVPIVASRVAGNIGVLGESYLGFFSARSAEDLAHQLQRAETDEAFYRKLREGVAEVARRLTPAEERRQWRQLLAQIEKPSRKAKKAGF
ncbi:MAG: glycosyltransferase [Bryobacterales bacterium]|nr:glycosyltransferase [Bryobacterales bacterium]